MLSDYRFDDLDLRVEPARFEYDQDAADTVTTTPRSETCSGSCMTCRG